MLLRVKKDHHSFGYAFTCFPCIFILQLQQNCTKLKSPDPRMKQKHSSRNNLSFLVVGIILMVLVDRFVFDGTRPYIEEARREAAQKQEQTIELASLPPEIRQKNKTPHRTIEPPPEPEALWKKFAVQVDIPPDQPKVVIIIDDLGMDRRRSKEIMALPPPVTLSFLPYAPKIKGLVEQGRKAGHEIMIHMPMEPMNPDLDPGPTVLRVDMPPSEFEDLLEQSLNAFEGYVGINNHMGSRLTQDKESMRIVMAHLYERGLLFVDSRTIHTSLADDIAASYRVPHAVRDVFLDHDPSLEGVQKSLRKLEAIAKKSGYAIAIGHPKANTIQALQEWIPTLQDKGIALAPISSVVTTATPEDTQALQR